MTLDITKDSLTLWGANNKMQQHVSLERVREACKNLRTVEDILDWGASTTRMYHSSSEETQDRAVAKVLFIALRQLEQELPDV